MSLLASVIAAAQDVNVRIIDDGRSGLGLRDLVVPLGALIAGIGGVLIGGVIQHRLEDKRTAREDRLDQARADREEGRELDRERRTENAEKRRLVGALRLAARKFDNARSAVALASGGRSHAHTVLGIDPGPSPEAVQLMATWMAPNAWAVHERVANIVDALGGMKGEAPDEDLSRLDDVYTALGSGIQNARAEITRLLREIGDPAAVQESPPMAEYDRDRYPQGGGHSREPQAE